MKLFILLLVCINLNFVSASGLDTHKAISQCISKCGRTPELPKSDDIQFSSKINIFYEHSNCVGSCTRPQKETIESLKKELSVCQSQLQQVQEKEPFIYNKLFRDYKKVEKSYHDNSCDTGVIPRSGCPDNKSVSK